MDLTQVKPQYIIDESGEKTAVILPIAVFQQLLQDAQELASVQELLEEAEDITAVAERRNEPTISHNDLLAELKKDGLLPN